MTRDALPVGTEPISGSASAGSDEILALENQVFDLEIALADAKADHELAGHLTLGLVVRLDVARERLDATLAERRNG